MFEPISLGVYTGDVAVLTPRLMGTKLHNDSHGSYYPELRRLIVDFYDGSANAAERRQRDLGKANNQLRPLICSPIAGHYGEPAGAAVAVNGSPARGILIHTHGVSTLLGRMQEHRHLRGNASEYARVFADRWLKDSVFYLDVVTGFYPITPQRVIVIRNATREGKPTNFCEQFAQLVSDELASREVPDYGTQWKAAWTRYLGEVVA